MRILNEEAIWTDGDSLNTTQLSDKGTFKCVMTRNHFLSYRNPIYREENRTIQ